MTGEHVNLDAHLLELSVEIKNQREIVTRLWTHGFSGRRAAGRLKALEVRLALQIDLLAVAQSVDAIELLNSVKSMLGAFRRSPRREAWESPVSFVSVCPRLTSLET